MAFAYSLDSFMLIPTALDRSVDFGRDLVGTMVAECYARYLVTDTASLLFLRM